MNPGEIVTEILHSKGKPGRKQRNKSRADRVTADQGGAAVCLMFDSFRG